MTSGQLDFTLDEQLPDRGDFGGGDFLENGFGFGDMVEWESLEIYQMYQILLWMSHRRGKKKMGRVECLQCCRRVFGSN